tara:strand:- start:5207 stop:5596 length:390 start_codon:yes stop_codon:yes gene_type:complete
MIPCLIPIGQRAVFYIPAKKLDVKYDQGAMLKTAKLIFHDFFIKHYNAYTVDVQESQGFWRKDYDDEETQDTSVRYEVSFEGEVEEFIHFLSEMCELIGEECIYLTMGPNSFLVTPNSTHTKKKSSKNS